MLQVIIGLTDAGGVERIGLDQIGAGFKVGLMYAADDFRLGQGEQVVVAFQVAAPGMGMVIVDLLISVSGILETLDTDAASFLLVAL
jgi:hypothetical protein